jgi:hypothetical protein
VEESQGASLAVGDNRSSGLVESTLWEGILQEVQGEMLAWELEVAPMHESGYAQLPTAEEAVSACLGCA